MSDTLFERRSTAQAHYKRGLELKRQGFLLEAEQEFRRSMESDPCYFDPVLELLVEQEEGGISEDIRTEQLLRRADQKYKLGRVLLEHNRPEKAVRHLRAACDMEKENSKYYCCLAEALIACGRSEEAWEILRLAALAPGGSDPSEYRARANLLLGKMHLKAGHKRRAQRRLLMACSLGMATEELRQFLKRLGVGALRRSFLISRLQHRERDFREKETASGEQRELLIPAESEP